ncbi:MAG: NAD-dependent epimerase/dehydratase family protein [Actinobacteria bacterium]|nr:NAD-dependent epimerase/dehydratase family protein [Actinomycetota bacterium]
MTRIWVIGANGLLGRSVSDALSPADRWNAPARISWNDEGRAVDQLRSTSQRFFNDVGSDSWQIFWCAGRGTVTGDIGGPYSELSPVKPFGPYGEHKVKCEELIQQWRSTTSCRVAICRISNLYGPNQDLSKGQGLISALTLAMLKHRPAPIYVPLETVRNFIYVDDAARIMIELSKVLSMRDSAAFIVKNVCAPLDLSIAMIVHEFTRVFGRRPPMVGRSPKVDAFSPRSLGVCSVVEQQIDEVPSTNLAVGISAIRRRVLLKL